MPDERYMTPDPPPPPEDPPRGGCLTLWLAFFLIFNGFFLYSYVRQGIWLAAAWSVFGLICVIGIWFWQKYAFWGLLLAFAFNVALNIDGRNVMGVLNNLTFMGLTYFLVHPKLEYFK